MDRPESELPEPGDQQKKMRLPWQRLAIVGLLFASFLAYSFIRTPTPAVNEPHYLAKAKHFWNPSWCSGDLFLESSNPHFVFYVTVGSFTQWWTLEQTVVFARIVALLLLAVGFESLLSTALKGYGRIVGATWLYLGLTAVGNLSGEWIVGGIEGKVFAYGFAFWGAGLAARSHMTRSHMSRAAICLGLAISFHPVVGIWCALATLFAALAPWVFSNSWEQLRTDVPGEIRATLLPASCLILCALPGIIPALQILGGADPENIRQAEWLQVFYRLRHHLDPAEFSPLAYAGYAALLLVWLIFRNRATLIDRGRFINAYLFGSFLIAVGGLVVGLILKNPALMKFYPFRLFDVLLPLVVSMGVIGFLGDLGNSCAVGNESTQHGPRLWRKLGWVLSGGALFYALIVPPVDRSPSRFPPLVLEDWIDCCHWIAQNSPPDTRVLTPSYGWAFKWYGERAEYVNYKDCPQDATSLIEWKRRYDELRRWEKSRSAGELSKSVLSQFSDHNQVDLVIAWPSKGTDLPVAYRNRSFAVFRTGQEKTGDATEGVSR